MTRKQESELDELGLRQHREAIRRKRGPLKWPVHDRPAKLTTPVDRLTFEQRLALGFALMNLEGE